MHATLIEEETYLASPRTMYRVLAEAHEIRERRDHLRHLSFSGASRPRNPILRILGSRLA